MGLKEDIDAGFTRTGQEVKDLRDKQGDLTGLNTTIKTSLVAAINEVNLSITAGASINDAVTALTSTWSSTKINSEISQAVTDLIDSAPGAADTLNELNNLINANDADITGILTALAARLRVDTASQGLTVTQQDNARANISVFSQSEMGDVLNADFVAVFEAALV